MSKIYVKLESIEISNGHETIRPSGILSKRKPGTMVAVRPCAEKYNNKTFLGMYLADAPTGFIGKQQGGKMILEMSDYTNPAIYILELDEIVWGYESWWGEIESEEKLREITNEDIDNCWYVKALQQINQPPVEARGTRKANGIYDTQ